MSINAHLKSACIFVSMQCRPQDMHKKLFSGRDYSAIIRLKLHENRDTNTFVTEDLTSSINASYKHYKTDQFSNCSKMFGLYHSHGHTKTSACIKVLREGCP